MEPLARLLLAVACAALLRAACAAAIPSLDNALSKPYEGVCISNIKGDRSRVGYTLPTIVIPPYKESSTFDINNACEEINLQLVGGVVTACDADAPPILKLGSDINSQGEIHRTGSLNTSLHCFVKLYCL